MSVTSVRAAARTATADGRVSKEDAKRIAHVATRTSGVSAGERAEVQKVLDSEVSFERGARATLRAAIGPAAESGLAGQIKSQITAKGLDFLVGLKQSREESIPSAVVASFDKLAEIFGNNDGGTIASGARELKIGRETVYVGSDTDYMGKENIGVYDSKGKALALLQINADNGYNLTLKWMKPDGRTTGDAIARIPSGADDRFPAGWVARAQAEIERRVGDGDDAGRDVSVRSLPPAVRQQYEFLQRTASDGTGVMSFELEGKKAYILADYSSVTTWTVVGSNGRELFNTQG